MPRYTAKQGAYALRKLRIGLREAGFTGPIIALVSSLHKFDDSIVNTIDGGYGRGYDGYLEEPLEQGTLEILIWYYCQANLTLGQRFTTQRILYSPLVINHQPPVVLLPADYRESSAFADANEIISSIHEAEAAGALSLTLSYKTETRLRLDFPGSVGDYCRLNLGSYGFVVPTQAFREAEQRKVGLQMVCIKGTTPDEGTFEPPEATLSVIPGSGVRLGLLRTSETLDVNLNFNLSIDVNGDTDLEFDVNGNIGLNFDANGNIDSKPSFLFMRERITINLSSKRMSECQVDSLELSRICIRRIIARYAWTEISELIKFFAGTGERGHGARYLFTGYRTYLDPKFTSKSHDRKEEDPAELHVVGDKVAAMQLCEIRLEINNAILPSEADIDFRNIDSNDLDSLQVHVGNPKWYVLWGPTSDTDELWPPSTTDRRRCMEDEVGDTYKTTWRHFQGDLGLFKFENVGTL